LPGDAESCGLRIGLSGAFDFAIQKSNNRRHGTQTYWRRERRSPARRPKGSKSKTYRPHIEKVLAAGPGILPKDLMLVVMRRHFRARRYDQAVAVAALVAPFIHPRLSGSNVTIKLREILAQRSDEELAEFAEEAEHLADLAEGGLVTAKPRGNA
jgi:hypothetical protein